MEDQKFIVSQALYEQLLERFDEEYMNSIDVLSDNFPRHKWYPEEAKQRIADKFNNK